MFINKARGGNHNICGQNVTRLRKERKLSQNRLASMLQILGLNVDKNAIQRIECGKRFVTDIETVAFAKVFGITTDELLSE